MAIPTRYRERLAARCDGQIIVTVDKDHCLLVYPMPDWEELERRATQETTDIGARASELLEDTLKKVRRTAITRIRQARRSSGP